MLSVMQRYFREKQTCESFAASSCTKEMVSKNCLANGRTVQFSHVSFPDFSSSIFFLLPAVKTASDKKYVTMSNCKFYRKCTFYYAKEGVFLNSGSHRLLFRVTVRTEVSTLVTIRAVLVLFHKQHYFDFIVK